MSVNGLTAVRKLLFLLLIRLASFLMFSVIIQLAKLPIYALTLTNKPLHHLLIALICVCLLFWTHSVWCDLESVILKFKLTNYSVDPTPTSLLRRPSTGSVSDC